MKTTNISMLLKDLEKTTLHLLDNITALIKEIDKTPKASAARQISIKAEVLEACRALSDEIFNSYQIHALLKGKYPKKTIFDTLRYLTRDGKLSKVGLMTYEVPARQRNAKEERE